MPGNLHLQELTLNTCCVQIIHLWKTVPTATLLRLEGEEVKQEEEE